MMENLSQQMAAIADKSDGARLLDTLKGVWDHLRTLSTSTAGLAIKAGGGVLVKIGAAAYNGIADGDMITVAAATDMPALAGTVSNAAFNVYTFTSDKAGTRTTTMGTEGASLAAVKFPARNSKHVMIGYIIVNPTGTGDFVGGTTALDDGTVVPNVVYINTIGPFDPTADY